MLKKMQNNLLFILGLPAILFSSSATVWANETATPATTPPAEKKSDGQPIKVTWKSGLRFEAAEGQARLKLGLRLINDWAWFIENNGQNSQDGTTFRAARLELEGDILENIIWKYQMDFASSHLFKDVFVGYSNIPALGTLRIGHMKEPFSLNELTSGKHWSLMERGLPNALVPARNTGIAVNNHIANQRASYGLGLFRDSDGSGKAADDNNYAVTGRLTGLAYSNGDNLLHLGGASSYRHLKGTVAYKAKPESSLASTYLESGDIDAKQVVLYGAEVASVFGATHFSGEYIGAYHDGPTNYTLCGFYAEIGLFLTGESRPYSKSSGVFTGVKPKTNFIKDGGAGAWEALARVSRLDFDKGSLNQGKLVDLSGGLNWYLNPHARMGVNYILALLDGQDAGHIVQSRFQVDF